MRLVVASTRAISSNSTRADSNVRCVHTTRRSHVVVSSEGHELNIMQGFFKTWTSNSGWTSRHYHGFDCDYCYIQLLLLLLLYIHMYLLSYICIHLNIYLYLYTYIGLSRLYGKCFAECELKIAFTSTAMQEDKKARSFSGVSFFPRLSRLITGYWPLNSYSSRWTKETN